MLLVVSGDDTAYPSAAYADNMRALLRERAPPERDVTIVVYPGAGHLLEPPHAPLARFALRSTEGRGVFQTGPVATADRQLAALLVDPQALIDYGGRPDYHAAAQWQHWQDAQSFFRTRLCASARATAAAAGEVIASDAVEVGLSASIELAKAVRAAGHFPPPHQSCKVIVTSRHLRSGRRLFTDRPTTIS